MQFYSLAYRRFTFVPEMLFIEKNLVQQSYVDYFGGERMGVTKGLEVNFGRKREINNWL